MRTIVADLRTGATLRQGHWGLGGQRWSTPSWNAPNTAGMNLHRQRVGVPPGEHVYLGTMCALPQHPVVPECANFRRVIFNQPYTVDRLVSSWHSTFARAAAISCVQPNNKSNRKSSCRGNAIASSDRLRPHHRFGKTLRVSRRGRDSASLHAASIEGGAASDNRSGPKSERGQPEGLAPFSAVRSPAGRWVNYMAYHGNG